jgi:hypothetical protein
LYLRDNRLQHANPHVRKGALAADSERMDARELQVRQQLAGEVWKVVAKWHDLEAYLFVADVYIEYCLVHLGADELDIMLRDVHAHLAKKPRLADTTQGYLESLVFRVLER